MNTLLIVNSVFLFLLFIVWSKKNWLNVVIKVFIASLFAFNLFFALKEYGFIIQGI